MRKLNPLVKRNGFFYHQLNRTAHTALYSQNIDVCPPPIAFEVFRILERPSREMPLKYGKVKQLEASEKFPSNEDFGKTAWTFKNLESAKQKFRELEAKYEKPTR